MTGTEVELHARDARTVDRAAPRVFLVDDHAMFRSGVRPSSGEAVDIVGEADEATQPSS